MTNFGLVVRGKPRSPIAQKSVDGIDRFQRQKRGIGILADDARRVVDTMFGRRMITEKFRNHFRGLSVAVLFRITFVDQGALPSR